MDELLASEGDAEMARDLGRAVDELSVDVERLEFATLLAGEYDQNDAVATIHAGAGGT